MHLEASIPNTVRLVSAREHQRQAAGGLTLELVYLLLTLTGESTF